MITEPKVDSPWCWVMAFSGFLIAGIVIGFTYSFGIFYVAILQEFPGKESEAAWIMSINFGMLMLWSPVTIYCCRRLTPRVVCCFGSLLGGLALYLASKSTNLGTLYVTFGLMHGIAGSFCYLSPILVLKTNFKKYLDLACGLSLAGITAGGALFSIFLPSLIDTRGWRGALQVCSYITVSATAFGPILMQRTDQAREIDSKDTKTSFLRMKSVLERLRLSDSSPWRNKAFSVLAIALVIASFLLAVPYCHIVNFAIKQGVDKTNASLLSLFLCLGSTIGRLFLGRLAGLWGMTRISMGQLVFLVLAVALTLCPLASSTAPLVVLSCVIGVMEGGFSWLLPLVVDDVFTDKKQALKGLRSLFLMITVPYMFGSPNAGFLYRVTLSYHTVFYVCGAIYFIAACLMSLVQYLLPPSNYVSIPEKIVILPANDSRDGLISCDTPYPDENRLIKSKTCSLLDLPVELHLSQTVNSIADGYSSLTDSKDKLLSVERVDPVWFFKQRGPLSEQYFENKMGMFSLPNCCPYTDITDQISGLRQIGEKFECSESKNGFHSVKYEELCHVTVGNLSDRDVKRDDVIDDDIIGITRLPSKKRDHGEKCLNEIVLTGEDEDDGYVTMPSRTTSEESDKSCSSENAADSSMYHSWEDIPDSPFEEVPMNVKCFHRVICTD